MIRTVLLVVFCVSLNACTTHSIVCPKEISLKGIVNQNKLLNDLKILSSPKMEGRKALSPGSKKAQDYIIKRFKESGLIAMTPDYKHTFNFPNSTENKAVNIIGFKKGSKYADEIIVITAHYDHLGKLGSKIYYGADDNASGVAAIISLAEYLKDKQTLHSVIFVATDAEEDRLYGAKALINASFFPLDKIKLNINLDMIAQGGSSNKLFVAGTRKTPELKPLINQIRKDAGICLKLGHDSHNKFAKRYSDLTNWNEASDHSIFLKKKIPYLYFGVDLHKHYHQTSDIFENINPNFYTAATESIVKSFLKIDQEFNIKKRF